MQDLAADVRSRIRSAAQEPHQQDAVPAGQDAVPDLDQPVVIAQQRRRADPGRCVIGLDELEVRRASCAAGRVQQTPAQRDVVEIARTTTARSPRGTASRRYVVADQAELSERRCPGLGGCRECQRRSIGRYALLLSKNLRQWVMCPHPRSAKSCLGI